MLKRLLKQRLIVCNSLRWQLLRRCGTGLIAIIAGCDTIDPNALMATGHSASESAGLTADFHGDVEFQAATGVDSSDCCEVAVPGSGSAGCSNATVEQCVCEYDRTCCSTEWSDSCVAYVEMLCGGCSGLSDDERAIAALLVDTDRDGLRDLDEILAGLNPNDRTDGPDIDGDGIENEFDLDVDGDGIRNAYDDDVDGDGIENTDDDDIDGDGLFNDEDDDDDGDGVDDDIDNDDDGDGLPDVEDFEVDDDDDPDDDNDDEDDENLLEALLDYLREVLKSDQPPPATTETKVYTQLLVEAMFRIGESVDRCYSDDDCEVGEVCGLVTCIADEPTTPANDMDGDGLRDELDLNNDRMSNDVDDNNNGIPDLLEFIFDEAEEFSFREVPDLVVKIKPGDERIALIEGAAPSGFDFVQIEIEDDSSDEGSEGITQTGDLDLTEDEEGAGLPIVPDGEADEGAEGVPDTGDLDLSEDEDDDESGPPDDGN